VSDLLEDTLAILADAGIKPEVQQGRHLKVRWHDAAGKRRLVVISRSPSSRFALLRNRAVLRRVLNTET
jgi:hypothetical protein